MLYFLNFKTLSDNYCLPNNRHDIIIQSRSVEDMYIFLPDIYQKSIYSIDYKSLKNAGIKIVLFDLDNTIAQINLTSPTKKLKDLFEDIKTIGLKPIIVSNNGKKRVEPFKDGLYVDAACHAFKPLKNKYKKIVNLYNVKPEEVAAIGDQMLTDVWGANRMGFTSILVNPISATDLHITKVNRLIENMIIRHFAKRGVFERGKYYE